MNRRYQHCDGITDIRRAEALGYLRDAADRGNAYVALYYALTNAKDNPDEARQRFEVLWDEGHVAALSGLSGYSLPHRIAYEAVEIARLEGRFNRCLRMQNELKSNGHTSMFL